jgi:predicted DNA-binding transcriptional regulator AlpA
VAQVGVEARETARKTVNIPDAAKVLGISRAAAYQLARRDELPVPVVRLGRRLVVSRLALDELLAAKEPVGPAESGVER